LAHEDYSRVRAHSVSSDRSFGFVIAAALVVIGAYPLLHGHPVRIWYLAAAGCFLAAALLYSRVLRPLNIVWFQLGRLLQKMTNPIVLGLILYGFLTPMALAMRLFGRDALALRFDPEASSYWIKREDKFSPDMRRQF